jgi:hypothetical protein
MKNRVHASLRRPYRVSEIAHHETGSLSKLSFVNMKKLSLLSRLVAILLFWVCSSNQQAQAANSETPEPNLEIAKQWWPDLTDYWTPFGWKYHRYRYNVFFDGTI